MPDIVPDQDGFRVLTPPDKGGGGFSYLGVVSLGNLLILAGMLGTGMLGIYTVGGSVQKLQDAIEHEAVMREDATRNLNQLMANNQAALTAQIGVTQQSMSHDMSLLQSQENNDIRGLNNVMSDLRNDLRQRPNGQPGR
jgi:hypothetical protein